MSALGATYAVGSTRGDLPVCVISIGGPYVVGAEVYGMKRFALWLSTALLAALLVAPFLVRVPPLENTMNPAALADPDSRFVEIDGLRVHYKEDGHGTRAFLLLHGFGASLFTWRDVLGDFGRLGRTVAYDRPAFGLTERPKNRDGKSPYGDAAQTALAVDLLDSLDIDRAVFVASSAGARVAVDVAVTHPERVAGLILVGPAVFTDSGPLRWLRPLLHTPQLSRLGPLLVRGIADYGDDGIRKAWHDPSLITPAVYAGYRKPLGVTDWDVALWEFTRADRAAIDAEQLDGLANVPTLLITGDDDRIVPTKHTVELAGRIPGSTLTVLQRCGHLPHEECPAAFMSAVTTFVNSLPAANR
jgi:pimeloyl-ACP methyl ester carboxylesterase